MAMNIGSGALVGLCLGLKAMVMPPADENTWWLVSTAMMSLYLVIDQYGPYSLSGV
jgi:hypothetical protein